MSFSSSTVSIGQSTKQSDYQRLLDNTQYNKAQTVSEISRIQSGTVTFEGPKTFSSASIFNDLSTFKSGTVFEAKPKVDGIATRSGTGSVSIECEYLSSAGNSVVDIKTKIIEIGDWNMLTNDSVDVTHFISDYDKIFSVFVNIRADAGLSQNLPFINGYHMPTDKTVSGQIMILTSVIRLTRADTSLFSSSLYDSISYNRGWVTITYEG